LIIDDLGMRKLPHTAAEDLLEIIMRRYERASTLLTSNRPVDDWGKLLGDVAPAPALAGYALGCRHPEEFAARCSRAGLAVENATVGISVALPPELGGIWLLRGESV